MQSAGQGVPTSLPSTRHLSSQPFSSQGEGEEEGGDGSMMKEEGEKMEKEGQKEGEVEV